MKKFMLSVLASVSFFAGLTSAYGEDLYPNEEYYYGLGEGVGDHRFPVDPKRPQCRWTIQDKTIGEFLRSRSDSRYFLKGMDSLDLASTTIDDPNANLTVVVPRDYAFKPGSYFDILELLSDRTRLFEVVSKHISQTALTADYSRQPNQQLETLAGTMMNFKVGISSMYRQSYYMNGSFFDYEGGVCLKNGIVFWEERKIFSEILAEKAGN